MDVCRNIIQILDCSFYMIINIVAFLSSIIPILLVTGPFLSDFAISLIGIFFLFIFIKEKMFFLFKNIYFNLFLIFNLIIIIRSLFSEDIFFSLKTSMFYFRFCFFTLGIIYILHILKDKFQKKFDYILIITFFIVTIDGYLQFFVGYNLIGFPSPQEFRLSGFFGSEMILGSYISKIFPLILIAFLNRNNKDNLFLFKLIILSIFTLIIVMLTGERASFFSLSLFIFIFFILTDLLNLKIKILFIFLIIFSLSLTLFLSEKVKNRFIDQTIYSFLGGETGFKSFKNMKKQIKNNENIKTYIFTHDTESHYISAYRMFKDNMLFGQGVKMFRKLCSKSNFNYNKWSCTTHPHNTYLQLLAETGLIGFVFIFLIFISSLFALIKILWCKFFTEKYTVDNINLCFYGFFVMFLWPLMPTGNFFHNWLSIMFFLPIGFFLYRTKRISFK